MNPLLENARGIAEGETPFIVRPCLIAMTTCYGKDWIGHFEFAAEDCIEGVLPIGPITFSARHERVMALCMAHAILSSP